MHLTTETYIGHENVRSFITSFIKEFQAIYGIDTPIKILIVGGSALALKYNLRRTVDIDADIRTEKGIKRIVKTTAKKLNIPEDFINDDFKMSYSYSKHLWDYAIFLKSFGKAEVYVVDDLSQLCMKIVSGRAKDKKDIDYLSMVVVSSGMSWSDVDSRLNQLYFGRVSIKRDVYNFSKRAFTKYYKRVH